MESAAARSLHVLSLLQSRPTWTAEELAERLGVTTRTVRRDVTRLRDLGYPVMAAPGPFGGYQLGSGGRAPAGAAVRRRGRRRRHRPAGRRAGRGERHRGRRGRRAWPSSSRCCPPWCASGSVTSWAPPCRWPPGRGPAVNADAARHRRPGLPAARAAEVPLPRRQRAGIRAPRRALSSSCTSGGAGTSWPATVIGTAGARSGSTACRAPCSPATVSPTPRSPTPRRWWPRAWPVASYAGAGPRGAGSCRSRGGRRDPPHRRHASSLTKTAPSCASARPTWSGSPATWPACRSPSGCVDPPELRTELRSLGLRLARQHR